MSIRVFFDNCTSPVLAETIGGYVKHLGQRADHIRDLPCGRHAADIEWITFLAGTGDEWLIVSGGGRIQKNKAERAAFRKAGLKGIVLAPAYQRTPINQQASFLIWRWPEILSLRKFAPPFLFEVPMRHASGIRQLPL